MARLRIASPAEGQPERSFAEAARAALEAVLADGAMVLVILYETPAIRTYVAVPAAVSLAEGLVAMQHRDFAPDPPAD
jgi:hypothetical protein